MKHEQGTSPILNENQNGSLDYSGYSAASIVGTPPGSKILDTHMGSQSSRIAAWDMGYDYWGWELDPEYFTAGNKRFELETQQQKLFI